MGQRKADFGVGDLPDTILPWAQWQAENKCDPYLLLM